MTLSQDALLLLDAMAAVGLGVEHIIKHAELEGVTRDRCMKAFEELERQGYIDATASGGHGNEVRVIWLTKVGKEAVTQLR